MSAEVDPPAFDWREQFKRQQKCQLDGHPAAYWHRRINATGTHIQFYCPDCDRPVTSERYGTKGFSVTADWLSTTLGLNPDELPEHRRSLRFHLCYLCGKTALCEFHHVAPQALYGKDADKYPVVPLCEPCHDQETKEFTERLRKHDEDVIKRYLAREARLSRRQGYKPREGVE